MKSKKTYYDYPEILVSTAVGGLFYSFLKIALEVQIFDLLNIHKKLSLTQISQRIKMPIASTRLFLQCLIHMQLLQWTNNQFQLSRLAKQYLIGGNQSLKWLEHLLNWNKSPSQLKKLLYSPSEQIWNAIKKDGKRIQKNFYAGWLHERRIFWGNNLAETYNFKKHKILLDLGCACGGWSISILRKHQHLKAILFDLPETHNSIQEYVQNNQLSDRAQILGGSFFKQIPTGADVVLAANVLHDWDTSDVKKILTQIHKSLPVKGRLLIWEFFLSNNFNGSSMAMIQALAVLGMHGRSGWQPTYQEMHQLLNHCGFKVIRQETNLIISERI